MVNFSHYWKSMVDAKPEWRNAYIDYPRLNAIIKRLKADRQCVINAAPAQNGETRLSSQQITEPPDDEVDDFDIYVSRSRSGVPLYVSNKSAAQTTPVERASESRNHLVAANVGPAGPPLPITSSRDHCVTPVVCTTPATMEPIRVPSSRCSPRDRGMVLDAPESTVPLSLPSPPEQPSELHPSTSRHDLALLFESQFTSESVKCIAWAMKALSRFEEYFERNQEAWENHRNTKKSKFAIRHLYEEVNYLHSFCETNILTIKTALKKYIHAVPDEPTRSTLDESSLAGDLFDLISRVDSLRASIELFFSKTFVQGDDLMAGIRLIRDRLGTPTISTRQSFRSGFFLSACIGLILYWAHVYFELKPSAGAKGHMSDVMPVFRLLSSIVFAFVVWSWVLYVCATQRINYLYVFEFPQTTSMTWMVCLEYALFLAFVVLTCGVLFVRFEMDRAFVGNSNWGLLAPYMLPLFIIILIASIVYPPRHVIRNARSAFFRVMSRIVVLPWGYVRFVEFFVADWGTSLVIPCMDLTYTLCFYTAGSKYAFENIDSWHDCSTLTNHYQWPLEMLPYFWRSCQTLKMFIRTRNKAHLVNHGKYQSFLAYFAVSWVFSFFPDLFALRVLVEILHFAAEVYAFAWDILMDWGFIRGRERQRMFKKNGIYVLAAAFDFFGRFFYLPAELWIKPRVSNGWLLLFQANLEIFRRASWSIFRIENENVNNLETYRSIDFVPDVALPEKGD